MRAAAGRLSGCGSGLRRDERPDERRVESHDELSSVLFSTGWSLIVRVNPRLLEALQRPFGLPHVRNPEQSGLVWSWR